MVGLMGSNDRFEIGVPNVVEPIEAFVDEHVVYQEVAKTVDQYAQTKSQAPIVACHHTKHDEKPGWDGEDQEEGVVFLKEARLLLVVVLVQIPEQAVHDVLVREPGGELHQNEGAEEDEDVGDRCHHKNKLSPKKNNRNKRNNGKAILLVASSF